MKKLGKANKLKKDQIKIPPFMRDMDTYMKALDIIARVNHIDEYVVAQKAQEPLPQFIVTTAQPPL